MCAASFFSIRQRETIGIEVSLCVRLTDVIGARCYLCYLFLGSPVFVHDRGGLRLEDRCRLIFYPASSPSAGALSPAISLPGLGIVIPECRSVNILLVV